MAMQKVVLEEVREMSGGGIEEEVEGNGIEEVEGNGIEKNRHFN